MTKVELGRKYIGRDGTQREVVGLSGDEVIYIETLPHKKRPGPPARALVYNFLGWADAAGAVDPNAGATSDAPPTPDETDGVGAAEVSSDASSDAVGDEGASPRRRSRSSAR